jgi:hypothetical protein
MGLGRLGMELGIEPRLLQSQRLGEMGQSVSSSAPLVSSAPCVLQQPSRIRRQLGLSSAELPTAESSVPPATEQQALGTKQSSTAAETKSESAETTTETESAPESGYEAKSAAEPTAKAES